MNLSNIVRNLSTILLLPVITLGYDARCLRQVYEENVIILVHPENCRKFYKCDHNFKIVEKNCPPLLEFNPLLKICDWPRGFCTPNSDKPVENVMNCNGLSDNAYYPDYAEECRSFYYCNNGVPRTGRCVPGSRFDMKSRKCLDEDQVLCKQEETPTISARSNLDCSSVNNDSLYLPNIQDDCKSYYHCVKGQFVKSYCEGSQLFNRKTKSCDWPQKVICKATSDFEDKTIEISKYNDFGNVNCENQQNDLIIGPNRNTHCESYFICLDGELVENYCAHPLIFNSALGICDFPENIRSCEITEDKQNLIDCSNRHKSVHKHPTDCSSFIECIHRHSQISSCPQGKFFDESTEKCVEDVESLCEISSVAKKSIELISIPNTDANEQQTSYPNYANTCRSYFSCENGKCHEEFCRNGTIFDTISSDCSETAKCNENQQASTLKIIRGRAAPSYIDCSVKQGRWYPDEDDCTKFYVCVYGNAYHQQCYSGQYFDRDSGICRRGNTANCPTNPTPNANCGKYTNGQLLPDMFYPNKYYVCENGFLLSKMCPTGQLFDQILLQCKSCVPLPTTTEAPIPTTTEKSKNCGDLPEGNFLPDYFDETTYYICVDGVLRHQSCPPPLLFDSVTLSCVSRPPIITVPPTSTQQPTSKNCGPTLEGQFVPDAFNNNQFYVCISGKLRQQKCPAGQTFDTQLMMCTSCDLQTEPPATLNCGPTPDGRFVPDSFDNKKFYVCVHGVLRHMQCPVGQSFDASILMCVDDLPSTPPTTVPPITVPPITVPPITVPPITVPPITVPPITVPPITVPPITVPPITVSPTTVPPITVPPITVPPSTVPPITVPPITAPPITVPPVTVPPITVPPITVPPITVPPATVPPTNVNCGPTQDGTNIPDVFNPKKFYRCNKGFLQHMNCPSNHIFNAAQGICISQEITTAWPRKDCGPTPDGGRLPDEFNNQKYYVCTQGILKHLSCPTGSIFNKATTQCESTEESTTPESKSCGFTPDGGIVPDALNKDKFYVCVRGVLRQMSCPEDSEFDQAIMQCSTLYPVTTLSSVSCGSTPDGGFIPDVFNSKFYYVCVRGTLQHRSCPEDWSFDASILMCRSLVPTTSTPSSLSCGPIPNGGIIPDAFNKTKYYICVDGIMRQQSCPFDMIFDATTGYCVSLPTSPPITTSTPTTPSITTPAPTIPPITTPTPTTPPITTPEPTTPPITTPAPTTPPITTPVPTTSPITIPTTKPTTSCGPLVNGQFIPDEFDNTKYYVCYNGKLRHQSCDNGFIFDKEALICLVQPTTVPATTPTLPNYSCGPTPDGGLIPDEFDNKKFYVCVRGVLRHFACPDGQSFDKTISQCQSNGTEPTTQPSISCGPTSDGGLVPDEFDNAKFYVCVQGFLHHYSCPKGELFDKTIMRCISNGSLTTLAPKACGPTSDGGLVPNEFDNTKFYVCIQGVLRQYSCPKGELFDKTTMRCVSNDSVTTPASKACGPTPDGGLIPDEFNNSKFYVCMQGVLSHYTCPNSELFDSDSLRCISNGSVTTPASKACGPTPDGGLIPDEFNNTKFYVCVQGTLRHYNCPNSELFNKSTLRCESGSPVTPAPSKDCGPTPNGSRVPDEFNNKKYYVCVDGILRHLDCPIDHFFDKSTMSCVLDTSTEIPTTTEASSTGNPFSCGPKQDGEVIPDMFNDSKYYVCVRGVLRHQSCPPGQLFDKSELYCAATSNSTCVNGAFKPNPGNSGQYFICLCSEWVSMSCPKDYYFDLNSNMCVLNKQLTCSQAENGKFFVDEQNHTKYYVCTNGVLINQSCPANQIFKKTISSCEMQLASCSNLENGNTIPDDFDDTKYFLCENGFLVPKHCASGKIFNANSLSCESKTEPEITTIPSQQKSCTSTDNGKFVANTLESDKYYICANGVLIPQSCATGLTFHIETMACEAERVQVSCDNLPQGAFVADVTNNSKYYICVMNALRSESCPVGFVFDSVDMYCKFDDINDEM